MPDRRSLLLELLPARDVLAQPPRFCALSREPWLKLESSAGFAPGRVVEVRYTQGLTDAVVRPIIRFVCSDGVNRDCLMSAASEGAGFWCGRVPPETSEIWISPTNRAGPFSFRLEHARTLPLASLVGRRLLSPKRSFFAASARMVGLRDEADLNLRWVFGRAETQDFGVWRARRATAAEIEATPNGPNFLIVLQGGGEEGLERTYASLQAQSYANWRLALVGASAAQATWLSSQADSRAKTEPALAAVAVSANETIGFFNAGDVFVDHALACYAHLFAERPDLDIVYCDETRVAVDGRPTPLYKPDWSPMLQSHAPYVGRAAFLQAERFAAGRASGLSTPEAIVAGALADAAIDRVGHVRRALVHIAAAGAQTVTASPPASARPPARVGIVIPTRDHIDLLEPCLASILQKTVYSDFEIVVVDNDSVEERTTATLARLRAQDSRLRVIPGPGAFNFSGLCNLGAQSLACDFLLFLNNDTEALQAEWLDNLVEMAGRPDIGAVGAKLLYPSGRIQHAGVVLGMGGVAGHFGEGQPGDAPGWLGTHDAPHEVSAVTGACLMVARAKFDAVGGFDAVNLPVELNDVDLCLRLAQRGWRTICDGRTRLIHHESASRGGGALRPQEVYRRERDYFLATWRHVIRDDPYFNPNLSLYDRTPKLG